MRYSLVLAKEVQQNLLPKDNPRVEGLDIAGTSIYCEETGGDYFDYLNVARDELLVVVGDVSDHGVSSAMLMTTARAFLRQRASQPGRLEEVATDVNNQLVRDVEDSGRFMTAFLMNTDRKKDTICWVNAGHDSAMVFSTRNGEWIELERTGLPFGVSESEIYREMCHDIEPGQIIIIGTDGVWESQDSEGRMFGKKRLFEIIEKNRNQPSGEILETVTDAIDRFCGAQERGDDVTLVIIKIL
jgi:sigma-B regulation protein RsbU (phosphoserine phosphatase)